MSDVARHARTIAEQCACIRTRQASRALSRLYDEALREAGIQISQLSVLVAVALYGEAGATIGELAATLVLERTTLTRNLRPLEEAGWIRIARSPADARARLVLLTRSGEAAIEKAMPLWQRAQRRVADAVGGRALDDLKSRLAAVVDTLVEREPEAVRTAPPRRRRPR
jgi:DNA-binding MarR family transcriptional regulator